MTLRVFVLILFVLLLFTPMIVEYFYASDIVPILQKLFPLWEDKPVAVVLSDVLFIEAGGLVLFGALIAGTILYISWANLDVRKVQFTEYIWSWRQMKEERDSPAGLVFGIVLLAVGIVYVVAAVIV